MTLPQFVNAAHLTLAWPDGRKSAFAAAPSAPDSASFVGKVDFQDNHVFAVDVIIFHLQAGHAVYVEDFKAYKDGGSDERARHADALLAEIGTAFQEHFSALPPAIAGLHVPLTAPLGTRVLLEVPGLSPLHFVLGYRDGDVANYSAMGQFADGIYMPLQISYLFADDAVLVGLDPSTPSERRGLIKTNGLTAELDRTAKHIKAAFQNFLAPTPTARALRPAAPGGAFATWI